MGKEGDFVKEGTPLAELDSTELLNELKEVERAVLKARINLKEAEEELQRNKSLFQQGLVAENEVRRAEIRYQLAKIDLEGLEEKYKNFERSLEETKILAPISGMVIQKNIQEGERWNPDTPWYSQNQPYLTIADLNRWVLKMKISEIDVEKISIGVKADIKVDAYPDKRYIGRVVNISPSAEEFGPMRKMFEVVIRLEGSHPELRPYISGEVKIITNIAKDVLWLPIEVVFRREDKRVVLIKDKEWWKEKEVKTGISNEEMIEIKEGLKEGDKVSLIDYLSKEELLKEEEWW
jgi:RND family efflux transporter MFP subunit